MHSSFHLVVPLSGQGQRFVQAGYTMPKPLVPINGEPLIQKVLSHFPLHWPTTFVLAANHVSSDLPQVLKTLRPAGQQHVIEPHKKGPGFALQSILEHLPDDDTGIVVSYCDFGLVWDVRQFEVFIKQSQCDACVVTYRGFHAHYLLPTNYAYCRLDGQRVSAIQEKLPFTDNREQEHASCGIYYFKNKAILKQALEAQVQLNLAYNGEYFTSLTVQALLQTQAQACVRVFEIGAFFQWGTPQDLQDYAYWEKAFSAWNALIATSPRPAVGQNLITMAGKGSRFHNVSSSAKPFLPIQGHPLFLHALESLPQATHNAFVSLQAHQDEFLSHLPQAAHGEDVIFLKDTPPGQALSAWEGLALLKPDRDVIISSCDHGLVLNPRVWRAFQQQSKLPDAAIFVMQGYPGAARKPLSYSYVAVQDCDSGATFPAVIGVSLKKPLTENPLADRVLVGTFWFRQPAVLKVILEEFLERQKHASSEVYFDTIFDLFLERGLHVQAIPLEGFLCWGDPDALAEALYWQEVFSGQHLAPRPRYAGC